VCVCVCVCVYIIDCDLETSRMMRPRPEFGSCATGEKKTHRREIIHNIVFSIASTELTRAGRVEYVRRVSASTLLQA
jgi:hypothetical protein